MSPDRERRIIDVDDVTPSRPRLRVSFDDEQPSPVAPGVNAATPALAASAAAARGAMSLKLIAIIAACVVAGGTAIVVVVVPNLSRPDFCAVLHKDLNSIRSSLPSQPEARQHPFRSALALTGEIGRYESMLNDLSDAAPSEISSDMKTARDTFKSEVDNAPGAVGNPAGALVTALYQAAIHAPAFEHVNQYARAHCGTPVF